MDDSEKKDGQIDRPTEVALFRHRLIQPLLDVADEERSSLLRELSARRYREPHGKKLRRFSSKTLRRWLRAYERDGLEGLKPRLRSDYGQSRTVPEEWVTQAIALRSQVPTRSGRTLLEILKRQPAFPGFTIQALNRVLKAKGWSRAQAMRKPAPRRRRWQAENVFDLLQGDATDGIYLPDPANPGKPIKTKLFLWVDDVSRLVPYAQFFFDEKLPRMEHTLKLALLRRGVPNRIYTDNGNVYRAHQFKAALAELGIKQHHSKAYTPQGRGKIERLFGVIQEHLYPELLNEKIDSLELLNECLWAWLDRVYHTQVHSETGQAPLDLYRSQLSSLRKADPVRLQRAFLWRYQRKVTNNGFLSLLGNRYSVDPQWTGRKLELRLDPYDLSQVFVYEKRVPIATATMVVQKSQRLLTLERLAPTPAVEPCGISFLSTLRQEYRQQRQREAEAVSFRKVEAQNER